MPGPKMTAVNKIEPVASNTLPRSDRVLALAPIHGLVPDGPVADQRSLRHPLSIRAICVAADRGRSVLAYDDGRWFARTTLPSAISTMASQ